MMQELTYAFPILSWLVFLFMIFAFIIWVKSGWRAIGRYMQDKAFPSMVQS